MSNELFSVRMTERELWCAWQSFEASFTDPDLMNEHERSVSRKLSAAHARARRQSK